jgi:hypothetical protein
LSFVACVVVGGSDLDSGSQGFVLAGPAYFATVG